MHILARGCWRLVRHPAFESAKKRVDARKKDILDDGVVRNNAHIQYGGACESDQMNLGLICLICLVDGLRLCCCRCVELSPHSALSHTATVDQKLWSF